MYLLLRQEEMESYLQYFNSYVNAQKQMTLEFVNQLTPAFSKESLTKQVEEILKSDKSNKEEEVVTLIKDLIEDDYDQRIGESYAYLYGNGNFTWGISEVPNITVDDPSPHSIIKDLIERMDKQYNILYEKDEDNLYREDEEKVWEEESKLSEEFDNLVKTNPAFKLLVQCVVEERKDFISSDREAAAFYLAYQEVININKGV